MKTFFTKGIAMRTKQALTATALMLALLISNKTWAINTKTCTGNGNWSNPAIWSPAGVPKDTDNVVISPSANTTLTVDGDYTCRNLYIGDANNHDAKVKITSGGNSLHITGDLQINPSSKNNNYELNAGPGDIYVEGTFSSWGTIGNNYFKVDNGGSLTITPNVSIADVDQHIQFDGSGTITFLGNFTDSYNKLDTKNGSTVNFYGNYTVNTTTADWNLEGSAHFYGTGTITATSNLLIPAVTIEAGASTTLSSSGAGTVEIEGNLINYGTFTPNKGYQLDASFSNNGTYTSGAVTVSMIGASVTIGGTQSTTFSTLQIGKSSNEPADVNVTVTKSFTASAVTFTATQLSKTLKLNTSLITATVTGNLTINQPTKDAKSNTVMVQAGTLSVGGNLVYAGTNNTDSRVAQVTVTSGTFNLTGTITWMSNSKVKTEVISVSTGTVNFASSITMGSASGTIKVTTSGTLNFNGTSAPSLTFGGATAPNLSLPYGSTCTFAKGLTAATTALTFAVGSTVQFTGTGTVTPTSVITFGHMQINTGVTLTAAGNLILKGNWTDNGTFTPGTNTVSFTGGGTQQITGAETFYKLTASTSGSILLLNNNITVSNTLTMSGHKINANGYTLTLGNGSGATLTYTLGQLYGGTFKRYWPTGAITSNSGSYYGYFPVGTSRKARPVTLNSTSNVTTAGYMSAIAVDASGGTNVTYTDNEGSQIEQIANQHNDLSISGGLAGGTFNIDVKFTDLGGGGGLSNLKLLTYTGGTMGSYGTHTTTGGPSGAPTGHRTGVSLANLAKNWVIGTNDKNASPLYTYLYSRKSGNWNDAGANGTWSYTAGGSGAACNCAPTSAAYATIYSGHTVTVTANDSIQYLDILSGGALTINSSKTFVVVSDLDMYGTGTFTHNGTLLTVGNELLMSSATSPTVNSPVTVIGYFTLPTGTAYTQSSGALTVNGDIDISGTLNFASGASMVLNGSNAYITGTGTVTTASGGNFPITNDHIFDEDANITFGTSGTNTKITIAATTSVTNCGIITINGKLMAADASTSQWLQQGNAILTVTDSLLPTGIFDPSTSPNTVYYNGTGAQKLISSTTAYYNLAATNGGTKTMVGDILITNSLILGGSTVLDESTYVISGNADLIMSGTAELKMTRSAEETYPEISGNYNLTGGTVTVTNSADSCQIQEGTYYNLKLNGTTPYNISSVTAISNNLDVTNTASINGNGPLTIGGTFTHSSTSNLSYLTDSITVGGINISAGTLACADQSINVNGSGGWTKASGATFNAPAGTVYFTGGNNQTLGGTSTTQSFYRLIVDKSSNTVTVGGSTTTLNIADDLQLKASVFKAGTATTINMTGGNWTNNGGVFTPDSSTVVFNADTVDQAIQGTNSAETFYKVTMNKPGSTLTVGGSLTTITLSSNMLLTAGTFNAGTNSPTFSMSGGNWTNNGGTFDPATSTNVFCSSGTQAINGTAVTQTFNKITVNKSAGTLSVSGSTTSLTLNSDMTLSAGTFDKGTASTIYLGGNWTNNGGVFTYGIGTVECNSGIDQMVNGSGTGTTFYNLTLNKSGGNLVIGGSITTLTVNNNLTFSAAGLITTGSNAMVVLPTTGSVVGAGAGKYIYGNEKIYVPNQAAPSKTFTIGDATVYCPIGVDFIGTTTGSGSVTAYTTTGDDAAINASGINASKSINRTWTMANTGVTGFTSYDATFTFVPGDIDAGTNTAAVEARRYTTSSWNTTTISTRTGTTTKITGETNWGKTQIGEKNTLTVAVHPSDLNGCSINSGSFTSSSSSTPTPTIQWQRDPNTGTFANINGSTDGGVYTNYTTSTLNVSSLAGLTNYKYRAVFTNINGSVTSNQATMTVTTTPTITGTTPAANCGTGAVALGATSSGGTINWYAASSGGASLGTGTSYNTGSIGSTTTYYVDATSGSCTTPSRTSVTATINPVPSATIAYSSCAGVDGNTTIRVSQASGTGPFTYKRGSGSFGSTDTFHVANGSTQNYYVQDANGCTSSANNFQATSAAPTQIPALSGSSSCSCPSMAEGRDVYLTDASGNLIAVINDKGHNLGTITATAYVHGSPVIINNNQGGTTAALGRNWVLDFTGTGLTPAVEVQFPYTNSEYNDLVTAALATPDLNDNIASATDLGSTQYEGPNEDDTYNTVGATMLATHRQLGNGTILGGKYVKIGLSANGEHWLHGGGGGQALPIRLLSFTATANQTAGRVEARWTTTLEINNSYFTVERSEDGVNFNEVGRLNGAGNSTAQLDYRLDDNKPFNGVSYYRLKQTDFDGQFSYSQTEAVSIGVQGYARLYPNPTTDVINIDLFSIKGQTKLTVMDMNGREVYSYHFTPDPSGRNTLSFRAKDILATGMYMVTIGSEGEVFKQKLIID